MNKRILLISLVVVLVVVLGVGVYFWRQSNTARSQQADEADVKAVVVGFGRVLKNIFLFSPTAAEDIEANYKDFLNPALLAQWKADPSKALTRSSITRIFVKINTAKRTGLIASRLKKKRGDFSPVTISLDDPEIILADQGNNEVESLVLRCDLAKRTRAILRQSSIGVRRMAVLEEHFGLGGDDPKTFEEIAKIIPREKGPGNITRERVRQIEKTAFKRLSANKHLRDIYKAWIS